MGEGNYVMCLEICKCLYSLKSALCQTTVIFDTVVAESNISTTVLRNFFVILRVLLCCSECESELVAWLGYYEL